MRPLDSDQVQQICKCWKCWRHVRKAGFGGGRTTMRSVMGDRPEPQSFLAAKAGWGRPGLGTSIVCLWAWRQHTDQNLGQPLKQVVLTSEILTSPETHTTQRLKTDNLGSISSHSDVFLTHILFAACYIRIWISAFAWKTERPGRTEALHSNA